MAKAPQQTDAHVGARIRLRRKELGLSQEKLGAKLGVTFQQIQKYEKGANRVGASRLQAMADVLEIPISYFFEDVPQARQAGTPHITALHIMRDPGAMELLTFYSRVSDPILRRAVVDLARNLAEVSGPAARADGARSAASE